MKLLSKFLIPMFVLNLIAEQGFVVIDNALKDDDLFALLIPKDFNTDKCFAYKIASFDCSSVKFDNEKHNFLLCTRKVWNEATRLAEKDTKVPEAYDYPQTKEFFNKLVIWKDNEIEIHNLSKEDLERMRKNSDL